MSEPGGSGGQGEKPLWTKGDFLKLVVQDPKVIKGWKDLQNPEYWERKRQLERAQEANQDGRGADAIDAPNDGLEEVNMEVDDGNAQPDGSNSGGDRSDVDSGAEEDNLDSQDSSGMTEQATDNDSAELIDVETVDHSSRGTEVGTIGNEVSDNVAGADDRRGMQVTHNYSLRRRSTVNRDYGDLARTAGEIGQKPTRKRKANMLVLSVQMKKGGMSRAPVTSSSRNSVAGPVTRSLRSRAAAPVARSSRSSVAVAVQNGDETVRRLPQWKPRQPRVPGPPYCQICKIYFQFPSGKSVHNQHFHQGKFWPCEYCGMDLASPGSRANHKKRFHSEEEEEERQFQDDNEDNAE